MAYKFQLGLSSLSGSLIQTGSFTLVDDNKVERFTIDRDTGDVSGSGLTSLATINSNAAIAATGSITAGTSFIIGSADLNETDMEKLDGITNGTVAANKAVVVDASSDADGFRNIDGTGDLTMGTITMSGFTVDADGDVALKTLAVDDGSTIGCDSDTDLMSLNSNLLTVNGTTLQKGALSGSSTIYGAGNVSTSGNFAATGSMSSAGATITGTSALATVTATTLSASSTLQAVGAVTFGSAMNVSGNMQVDGTVVNFPNVGAASLDTGDLMLSLDATSKDLQARTRANVITDFAGVMAGTVTATGLSDSSGVLSIDIENLDAEVIATGDKIIFNDAGDNGLHSETVDDLFAKGMPLLAEAAMTVADDYVVFLDGGASGDGKKEKWADLVALMAGSGLSATDGVLSSEAASTPVNLGDAAGRLVEGFNYSSVDFTAARIWITPASPSAGDKVIVKAPANADVFNLRVSGGEGSKIDGLDSVYLNSPSGSITMTYLGSDSWSIS